MKELLLPIAGLALVAMFATVSRIGAMVLIIVVLGILLNSERRFL